MSTVNNWQAWESEVAERLNGKPVKYSGRMTGFKGDVKTKNFICDCKYTQSNKYALTGDIWYKVSTWALNENKSPMMAICIDGDELSKLIVVSAYTMTEEISASKTRKSYTVTKKSVGECIEIVHNSWSDKVVVYDMEDFLSWNNFE